MFKMFVISFRNIKRCFRETCACWMDKISYRVLHIKLFLHGELHSVCSVISVITR